MIIPKFLSIGVGVVTTSSLKSISFWGVSVFVQSQDLFSCLCAHLWPLKHKH